MTRSKELVFYSWIPLSPEVSRLSLYTRELQEAFTYSGYTDYIHFASITPSKEDLFMVIRFYCIQSQSYYSTQYSEHICVKRVEASEL